MTNVLILLALPESTCTQYHDTLVEKFPELAVTSVDHHSKAGPYLPSAEVLMTFGPMVTPRVFEQAPNLKWVQSLGTGVDGIIDQPALKPGTIVTKIHGIHGAPLSEAAITHMMALNRRLPEVVRNQASRKWEKLPLPLVEGKTVGIFGVGAIAEELAPKCKALGMKVVGISSGTRKVPGFDEMAHRDELVQAVAGLDFLVLLTPLTDKTRGIVDAGVFKAMKPTAYLINLARGGVVDEDALVAALDTGEIAGAALDVFSKEPLPADHPLWAREDILITPHNAGFNNEYATRALPAIEANMRHFLAGEFDRMINIVER